MIDERTKYANKCLPIVKKDGRLWETEIFLRMALLF